MISITKLFFDIKEIATEHNNVKKVTEGNILNILEQNDITYPLFNVDVEDTIVEGAFNKHTIRLTIADLNNDNTIDVKNNCSLILQDIIKKLAYDQHYNYTITSPVIQYFVENSYNENVAGVYANVVFRVPYNLDACDNPINQGLWTEEGNGLEFIFIDAKNILIDASGFDGQLNSSVTNVQLLANAINDLTSLFNPDNYYTKVEIDNMLDDVTFDLNVTGLTHYYNKTEVDLLIDSVSGSTVDLSNYYTKSEVYTKNEVDTLISNLDFDLNISGLTNYYEKSYIDNLISSYYTKVETDNLLLGKSNTGHTHDDRYYTESEVDILISNITGSTTDLTNYYNKTQTDNLLNLRSQTGHTHDDRYYTESEVDTLISNIDVDLTNYYNKTEIINITGLTNYYNKAEVDLLIDSVTGSTTDLTNYYNKTQTDNLLNLRSQTGHTHDDRYYTESEVDALIDAIGFDLSITGLTNYYSKIEVDNLLIDYYNKIEVDNLLLGKSNTGHTHDDRYYTESEVDTLISNIDVDLTNYYTKSEVLNLSALTYFYNKNQVDALINDIDFDLSITGLTHYYEKNYIDTLIYNYYNKTQTDNLLNLRSQTGHTHDDRYYTESEVDTLISNINLSNYYNKTQTDSLLNLRSQTGHTHLMANITDLNLSNYLHTGSTNSISTITGSTYIANSTDLNKILEFTTNVPVTITLPTGLTTGYQVTFMNTLGNNMSFVAGVGTNVYSVDNLSVLFKQYGAVTAYYNGTNWKIFGMLSDLDVDIALNDLDNVTITSPISGQTLVYNGSSWINSGITSGGSTDLTNYYNKTQTDSLLNLRSQTGHTHLMANITDLNLSNYLTTGSTLDILNDVVITTPISGQTLVYNGSSWINSGITSGGSTDLTNYLQKHSTGSTSGTAFDLDILDYSGTIKFNSSQNSGTMRGFTEIGPANVKIFNGENNFNSWINVGAGGTGISLNVSGGTISTNNFHIDYNSTSSSKVLKYTTDLSSSYDDRTLVDKAYVFNSISGITSGGSIDLTDLSNTILYNNSNTLSGISNVIIIEGGGNNKIYNAIYNYTNNTIDISNILFIVFSGTYYEDQQINVPTEQTLNLYFQPNTYVEYTTSSTNINYGDNSTINILGYGKFNRPYSSYSIIHNDNNNTLNLNFEADECTNNLLFTNASGNFNINIKKLIINLDNVFLIAGQISGANIDINIDHIVGGDTNSNFYIFEYCKNSNNINCEIGDIEYQMFFCINEMEELLPQYIRNIVVKNSNGNSVTPSKLTGILCKGISVTTFGYSKYTSYKFIDEFKVILTGRFYDINTYGITNTEYPSLILTDYIELNSPIILANNSINYYLNNLNITSTNYIFELQTNISGIFLNNVYFKIYNNNPIIYTQSSYYVTVYKHNNSYSNESLVDDIAMITENTVTPL